MRFRSRPVWGQACVCASAGHVGAISVHQLQALGLGRTRPPGGHHSGAQLLLLFRRVLLSLQT